MKHFFSYILIFSLLSCSDQISMKDTTWQYDYGNGRLDKIKFTKRDYTQYSAETDEHYYGSYTIKGNIIIMHQKKGEFDNEFKEDSRHRAGESTFEMLVQNGNELGFKDNWQEDHWIDNYFLSPDGASMSPARPSMSRNR